MRGTGVGAGGVSPPRPAVFGDALRRLAAAATYLTLPDGASDQIVRTVTGNSRTLRFTSRGFESE